MALNIQRSVTDNQSRHQSVSLNDKIKDMHHLQEPEIQTAQPKDLSLTE